MPPSAPRRPASVKTAAEYLEVHQRTIWRWINDGLLPAYRLGPHLVRVDLDDLGELSKRIPVASNGQGR